MEHKCEMKVLKTRICSLCVTSLSHKDVTHKVHIVFNTFISHICFEIEEHLFTLAEMSILDVFWRVLTIKIQSIVELP